MNSLVLVPCACKRKKTKHFLASLCSILLLTDEVSASNSSSSVVFNLLAVANSYYFISNVIKTMCVVRRDVYKRQVQDSSGE